MTSDKPRRQVRDFFDGYEDANGVDHSSKPQSALDMVIAAVEEDCGKEFKK